MSEQIVYLDTSTIREGKLEEVKNAMKLLATFVEKNMPQLITYGFYLNQNESRMTVFAIHPDFTSLKNHLDRGAEEFQKFAELIELNKIEVYGSITDGVRRRLEKKAQKLGNATLTVHNFYAGFTR